MPIFNTSTVLRLLPLPLTLIIYCIFTVIRSNNDELHYDLSGLVNTAPSSSTKTTITTNSFNFTETKSTFSSAVQTFWADFSVALEDARPHCSPAQTEDGHSTRSGTTLNTTNSSTNRLLDFNDEHEAALFRGNYLISTSMQKLAPRLIFAKGEQGFVTTANARHMSVSLVSLRMLRRTGCQLPVEVFIEDWTKYDPVVCEIVLPTLNAACVVLSEIYGTASSKQQPTSYQLKLFAILFSSFEHVLFLDGDVFPAHNPTSLFSTPPYTTHGLVVWPDLIGFKISKHYHHTTTITHEPQLSQASTESGAILLDKEKHRESLLMMVYYNYYGPEYYTSLICQGSQGAWDKKTFIQAAMAVGMPWYQVKADIAGLGYFEDGDYRLSGMVLMDPRNDFLYQPPSKTRFHSGDRRQTANLEDKGTTATGYKPILVHQNVHKLDPAQILSMNGTTAKTKDGKYTRMWGDLEETVETFGYDIERQVWEVTIEEGCRADKDSGNCVNLREYFTEVFGIFDRTDG